MLDSINRAGQASIDWSKVTNMKRTSGNEQDITSHASQANADNQKQAYNQNKLNKEIDKVNNQLESLNHSLRMKFSEEAEQFYVEVIDVRTNEVLESIPGKHMIDLAAKLKDMIGFFIDEKR